LAAFEAEKYSQRERNENVRMVILKPGMKAIWFDLMAQLWIKCFWMRFKSMFYKS
jgi:hypothetical protein